MVRNRGGKTMNKSLSKERTYATSFPPSMRRTRRSSAEENTPIATSEKRKKTKRAKKSQKVQENVIFIMELLSLGCVFYG